VVWDGSSLEASWLAALVKVGGVGSWVYVRVVGYVRSSFFLRVSSLSDGDKGFDFSGR
jgi:hypothetical protein